MKKSSFATIALSISVALLASACGGSPDGTDLTGMPEDEQQTVAAQQEQQAINTDVGPCVDGRNSQCNGNGTKKPPIDEETNVGPCVIGVNSPCNGNGTKKPPIDEETNVGICIIGVDSPCNGDGNGSKPDEVDFPHKKGPIPLTDKQHQGS